MAAPSSPTTAALLGPLEVLTDVCLQLDLVDLVHVAETCKRFRHGDGGLETAELPTKSPVVAALREHAFPGGELVPSSRPVGCSESWVAYLARCARQRRCREAPPVAAGFEHTLFVDSADRLLACGVGAAVGHGDENAALSTLMLLPAMDAIRVRSVAAGKAHSLALGWDGRVFSWGRNLHGQLGHGDLLARASPVLIEEGMEGVCGIGSAYDHSLAVTRSGTVFSWGTLLTRSSRGKTELRPVAVEGFGGVRIRSVCGGQGKIFAIGRNGDVFAWGLNFSGLLGPGSHGDQPSPKRAEALRDVRVSAVSVGGEHALALAEDGLVYAWSENHSRAVLGNPHVERELLPKPVEALRGVRVGSIAAAGDRSYAVADTGELWAWGLDSNYAPLGHGEGWPCALPKPIEALRDVKVDAVVANGLHTLARADDGRVYSWGNTAIVRQGALGLGSSVGGAEVRVSTPQRIFGLRVACGL
jgi:alpha-tubulin suppressor-like RCC1 family protein